MVCYQVYEIFFNKNNQRVATVYDYKLGREVEIMDHNIRLKNFLNMDIGDNIEFDSRYHGWVRGRVIRITSVPEDRDEYMVEYDIDGTLYQDTTTGNFMRYY